VGTTCRKKNKRHNQNKVVFHLTKPSLNAKYYKFLVSPAGGGVDGRIDISGGSELITIFFFHLRHFVTSSIRRTKASRKFSSRRNSAEPGECRGVDEMTFF